MFLGVEIGGTKLQLGVGAGQGTLVELLRFDVRQADGAAGILRQIAAGARQLLTRHALTAIGIGFGGPIDSVAGRVIKSHHVAGWDDCRLIDWCRSELDLPAVLENDCDAAALAEAHFGAGQGSNPVFYVTVGTGIGGGLVVDGRIYRGAGRGAAEIGHLRPGVSAEQPSQIVESLASGWGITACTQSRLASAAPADRDDLLQRTGGNADALTTRIVAEAAVAGNEVAQAVFAQASQTLGWAIAQTITLTAPRVVVLGGGVSLAPASLLLDPVRAATARYVFPPFVDQYSILPAALGEEVVVHGALAAARQRFLNEAPAALAKSE